MNQQLRNIFAAHAQRRHFDADHVQAMQKVFAEQALAHALFQLLVRGRDHAHVDAHRDLPADAIELAFCEHAQQPRLQLRRHVADLVEKQRAAVGLLEAPAPQLIRAGERALLVAEQFRLQQIRSEGGRVECDERFRSARAVTMQRAGDELLAGARLASDQHGHARARQPADRAKHFLHRRRLAEHFGNALRFQRGLRSRDGAAEQRAAPGRRPGRRRTASADTRTRRPGTQRPRCRDPNAQS